MASFFSDATASNVFKYCDTARCVVESGDTTGAVAWRCCNRVDRHDTVAEKRMDSAVHLRAMISSVARFDRPVAHRHRRLRVPAMHLIGRKRY